MLSFILVVRFLYQNSTSDLISNCGVSKVVKLPHPRNKRSDGIPFNETVPAGYAQYAHANIYAHLNRSTGHFHKSVAVGLMLERY